MPQEGPKPEQFQLDIDEQIEEEADQNTKNNDSGTTNDQEDRVKIVANDDETCGEGHRKDPSGWN